MGSYNNLSFESLVNLECDLIDQLCSRDTFVQVNAATRLAAVRARLDII